MIRKARIEDTQSIFDLIQVYVEQEILLPRSIETIRLEIELTWVSTTEDEKVEGTLNLTQFEKDLYELRAMVVSEKIQGQGIGTALLYEVENYIKRNLYLPMRLFVLTYDPAFFIKNGFERVSKEIFPQKIYDVCQFCARNSECKEIAVHKIIS